MHEHLREAVVDMLTLSQQCVAQQPFQVQETGHQNGKGERTMKMDALLEDAQVGYLRDRKLPVHVFSEEQGTIQIHDKPEFLAAIDPLDGSVNYKYGRGLLPFGTFITVFCNTSPNLNEVLAAGAIEYTHNVAWVYADGQTTDLRGHAVSIKKDWPITWSTPIYLDMFYQNAFQRFEPLAQKLFIRNSGSTIGNLALVLSGVAVGMGSACMRPEEVGAVSALIQGAGGVAELLDGTTLSNRSFSPDSTYPIFAGVESIAQFVIEQTASRV